MKKFAFTLTELVITMIVITLVIVVTLPLTKRKMDRVDTYSYYLGYTLAKNISVLLDDSMLTSQTTKTLAFNDKLKKIFSDNAFIKFIQASIGVNPAYASGLCQCYLMGGTSCGSHQTQSAVVNDAACSQMQYSLSASVNHVAGCYYDCDYIEDKEETPVSCEGLCIIGLKSPSTGADVAQEERHPSYTESECKALAAHDCGNDCVYYVKNWIPDQGYDAEKCAPAQQECLGTCSMIVIDVGDNDRFMNSEVHENMTEQGCYSYGSQTPGYNLVYEDIRWEAYADCKSEPVTPPDDPDVPDVPQLPSREDFCLKIKDTLNIASESCSSPDMADDVVEFSDLTPHIIFSNGLKLYLSAGGQIPELSDSTDENDKIGFILYIDVNGDSGKSILYEDVFPFYILLSGKVIPGYSTNPYTGAGSKTHLSLNLLYDDYSATTGDRSVKIQLKDANFQLAACRSGYVTSKTYCNKDDKVIEIYDICNQQYRDCRMIVNKPFKMF